MYLSYKFIFQTVYLFFGIAIAFGSSLSAQGLQKYDDDLHKIDSIVSTGYALEALEMTSEIYLDYRLSDTISNKFKRLCTNYLFVLENLNLNEKAIALSHEVIDLKLGKEVNAHVFLTLSLIHEKSANKELAKEYLDLSKPLVFESSNDSLKAVWFIRASSYNRVLDNLDSAQFFANEAYQLSKKIGNKSTIATSAFLHAIFIQDDSLKLEVKRESLQMFLAVKDFRLGTAQCLSIYGYYMKKENKEKALEYLTKAQEIGRKTSSIDVKVNLFYVLKEHYAAQGDFAQAYSYADSLDVVRQLVYIRMDRIKLLSTDFKFKTNRLKNELSKSEQIVAGKEKQKENLIYIIAITLAFLMLILYIAFDQRKKKLIATQNQKIINQQNEDLVKANVEYKLLMQEMNHRLKNNLSTLSAILEIQANQESDPKINAALQKSLERVDLLANLHKRILSLEPQKVYVSDEILLEVIKGQLFLFNTLEDNVKIELDPIKLSTKNLNAVTIILNELLTNALKYGEGGKSPKINISLKNKEGKICFSITNYGSMMPKNYHITNKDSSGLYMTKLLVSQLGGDLSWESVNDSTTFFFSY